MNDYKYEIGDNITDCNRDLTIINRERRMKNYNQKWYKVKCNICGWDEKWINELQINGKRKYRCACCSGQIVVPGINDIATTHPDKIKFFAHYDDCLTHSHGTHKKVEAKCPSCGDITLRPINYITKYNNYPCGKCGDGFSIPEKFIYNILRYCINFRFCYFYKIACKGRKYSLNSQIFCNKNAVLAHFSDRNCIFIQQNVTILSS